MEQISFTGGCHQKITINLVDLLGHEVDLSSIVYAEWNLAKYGESAKIITKNTENVNEIRINGNNLFVTLDGTDTENLFGLFRHQLFLKDVTDKEFVIELGFITINKKIFKEFITI